MSSVYDYVVSMLQPKLSFGFTTNSFGTYNNFTSTYDQDLRLFHNDSLEKLYEIHLRFTSEYTWEQFEQNKTSLYEKEFENLIVFRDNTSGHILKLQRIETFYYPSESSNPDDEYDDPNEPIINFLDQEHFR